MNSSKIVLIILATIAIVIFAYLMRRGAFLRVSAYFAETKEELKKCTWPTWEELKGSTVVVAVAIAILGLFTAVADACVLYVVSRII